MKPFEITYLGLQPLLPPLYTHVHRRLREMVLEYNEVPEVLDVGGRKSHYTIGLPASFTIIDLPRESEVQRALNLGVNDEIVRATKNRRSNISEIIFGDMTRSSLPGNKFDCVVSVEVLEHVEEDERFVQEVHRVLKSGGRFLMTTPNGDFLKNTNPDHKRHYKKAELEGLLTSVFDDCQVEYCIVGGKYRKLGLKSWDFKRPVQTGLSMFGNIVNSIQSASASVKGRSSGTHHLIAVARKK